MKRNYLLLTVLGIFALTNCLAIAEQAKKEIDKCKNQIQRLIPTYDTRATTKSNVELLVSNDGSIGYTSQKGVIASCNWPRESKRSYIYGSGFCFSAKKSVGGQKVKFSEIGYNPSNGTTYYVPGRIEDGDKVETTTKRTYYQVYMSTEHNLTDGKAIDSDELPYSWAVWKNDNSESGRFGTYVYDTKKRNTTNYKLGPAFVSEEDMFMSFKDTDSLRFQGNKDSLRSLGHPARMQWEQRLYSWANPTYKDMVIIMLYGINTSKDTLTDGWIGYLADTDLKVFGGDSLGVQNDLVRYYNEESKLNLATTWTKSDKGESNFGYLGVSLLMTPAVDDNNYVRKDLSFYTPDDQIGLRTCKFFSIEEDNQILDNLYDKISEDSFDTKTTPGDVRMLLGSGPYNLLPNDTVKVAVMLNFADAKSGADADGTAADMENLINEVKKGRALFYDQGMTTVENNYASNLSVNYIFPNPAEDESTIEIIMPEAGNAEVKIIDILGDQIVAGKYYLQSGLNRILLNTEGLGSGNYYVILNYSGSSVMSKLCVIK